VRALEGVKTLTFDIKQTRDYLQELDFKTLFNELGWSQPRNPRPTTVTIQGLSYTQQAIAELAGIVVFEIKMEDGKIPDAKTRMFIHKEISSHSQENLLIFLDAPRSQSLWYWVKRDPSSTKTYPNEHLYVKGQPGDLALGKLGSMVFDAGDFDQAGKISVLEVASRLQKALDIEKVTKRFYEDFKQERLNFFASIKGIDDERDRRWYTSALLNRLMFIYFLQRKWFIDNGNINYLPISLQAILLTMSIPDISMLKKFLKIRQA
jgi:hypothetical protein